MLEVVPLGLHSTEGGAAQAVQLERKALPLRAEHLHGDAAWWRCPWASRAGGSAPAPHSHLEHVGLLADPDLAAHGRHLAPADEGAQRQKVVAHAGQPVAVVPGGVVVHQLAAQQCLEAARGAAVPARPRRLGAQRWASAGAAAGPPAPSYLQNSHQLVCLSG